MLLALFLINEAILIALMVLARRKTTQFLKQHPSIGNSADLQAFKEMARWQMYLALGSILFLLTSMGLTLALLFALGPVFLLVLAVVSFAIFTLSQSFKQLENRVRNLSCATPALEEQYREIGRSWKEDLYPNF